MEYPPYKFTGKEEDPETGLIYFGARYYDAAVGIWHGVDPLAEKYANYNPFNYVLNNPIKFVDPTGLYPEEDGIDPPSLFSGVKEIWQNFKNDIFGLNEGPSFNDFLNTTLEKISLWSDFYTSVGKGIIEEVPIAGEFSSALEGDYIGLAVGLVPFGNKINKVIRKATDLPIIEKGTKEWQETVNILKKSDNKKINVRVESASDAKDLLLESRGNMNRYKQYEENKRYSKGYEVHNQINDREMDVGNNLQHIKWKDSKTGGHIYYNKPN